LNWLTVLQVAGGALLLIFAMLRVERKRWWVVALFFELPVITLAVIWANLYQLWSEVLVGATIAGLIAGAWWLLYGRKLPAPTSDTIKVWGQEDAPKPRPQQLQAEVQRLREEKAKLEEELRRLKGGNGRSGSDPKGLGDP